MRPLVDSDILRYEIGFSGEFKDEDGNPQLLDFDRVAQLLNDKIDIICDDVQATEPPVLYLTGDEKLAKKLNKYIDEEDRVEYKPNFRHAIAKTKVYKGTRKADKPYHYDNLTAYMMANYECHISNGLEADDSMCIEQIKYLDSDNLTIICSRDKDLRMCPGLHYSWECGKQGSIGPIKVHEDDGWLEERPDGKIIGYGDKFFYYQLLVGDAVDNIPGLKGCGPKKAYPLLENIEGTRNMYETVRDLYKEKMGDDWKEYLQEQANLLWMVRELDKDGEPVMFSPPRKEDDE